MYRIGFIVLFIFSKSSAQNLSFKWSEKVPPKGILNYCGTAVNQIFTSQTQGTEMILLRRFDSSMQLKEEDTLMLTNKNEEYLTSFVTNSHFVYVTAQKASKKQTNILLSKNSLQNLSQPATSVAADLKDGYRGMVMFYYSHDKSKLLITNFSFKAATQTTKRDFVVINTASGTIHFSGSASIQGAGEQIGVTNEGTVWLSALQVYSLKNRLVEKPKTQQKIIFVTPDTKEKEFTIRFDSKYTPGFDFIQNNAGELYITGFAYDNNSKATRLSNSELFMYKVDSEQGTVTDSSFINFTGLYPENKLNLEDRLPYTIKHLYKRNDGGYTVLAEQYQFIMGQYSNSQKYNDIACIQLSKDFTFESVLRIPKLQYGTDNPSFLSTVIGDTVYLIYNDLTENLNADGDKLSYPSNKQNKNGLFLISIDKKVKYKKQLLYDYSSGDPIPQILSSFVLNKHSILLSADGQIGTVTIKK
jgi:hypothetical protein